MKKNNECTSKVNHQFSHSFALLSDEELAAWKSQCRLLTGKESLEKLAAALFVKVSVFKGLRITYTVVPEVSQFFGLSGDLEALTVSEPSEEWGEPVLI